MNKILKFENIEDIFSTYFQVRLDLYEKRKQNLLRVLQEELCVLENKRKFISFVLQRKIQLETMREDELEAFLVRCNFQKMETSFDYEVGYVPAGYEHRPDLISNVFYGTPKNWWLLMLVNSITDPFEGFNENDQILIPKIR